MPCQKNFISAPHRLRNPLLANAISLSLASLFSVPVQAATIDVTGACTLADAITAANTDASTGNCTAGLGDDTLVLTNSSVHSFTVGAYAADGDNALPSIITPITIQGNNATIERDSGSATDFRLIHVSSDGELKLENASLSGGVASATGFGSDGGALLNRGTVTLNNSTVSNNSAAEFGGGLANFSSTITLHNSTVSRNSTGYYGGGLYNYSSDVTLNSSTVSGNSADYDGGGLSNYSSTVMLTNSTVSGNSADYYGGGLYSNSSNVTLNSSTVSSNSANYDGGGLSNISSTVTLNNSTVSGNSADYGGGLYNYSSNVTLNNSTVSGNSADYDGGGLYNYSSTVTLSNSIVANSTGGDCYQNGGSFDDFTNWFENDRCDGSSGDGDPKLGRLANNGGPTQTHALLADSGAIDNGDITCADPPIDGLDQRGITRPQGEACDIGAFEYFDDTSFFVIPTKNGKVVIFSL